MKSIFCLISIFFASLLSADNFINTVDFDYFVLEKMEQYNVPGLALAVVKEGEIEVLKAYGELEKGVDQPVTTDSLFAVGSCTKAMTAAALAILVDEGTLNWDTPVRNYLPYFDLSDKKLTQNITIADVLSHRTGLDAANNLWYGTNFKRAELLFKLKMVKAVEPFRKSWIYNNILYMAAGEIIPQVTKTSWDDYVVKRLFKPLRMYNSGTRFDDFRKSDSIAIPHVNTPTGVRSFQHRSVDQIGPAGSVVSSASDMAQWITMLLNRGVYNGKQILSEDRIQELFTPLAKVKDKPLVQYGLGWMIQDYQGQTLVSHNGLLDGTTARMAMIPEKGIGVVILANLHNTPLSQVLTNTILDAYLELEFHDWQTEFPDNPPIEKKLPPLYKTSEDLLNYASKYTSDLYGDAFVLWDNNHLVYKYQNFIGDLIPTGKNRFAFVPSYEFVYAPVKELKFSSDGFEDPFLGSNFNKVSNEVLWYGYWGWGYPTAIDSL